MTFTDHSLERIDERLRGQLRLSKKKVNHLKKKIMRAGFVYPHQNQAVRIAKLDEKVKLERNWNKSKFADELWAIINNNRVISVMFRNGNQSKTLEHFNYGVDFIWSVV